MDKPSGLAGVCYVLVLIAFVVAASGAIVAVVQTVVLPALFDDRSVQIQTTVDASAVDELPDNASAMDQVPVSVKLKNPSLAESLAALATIIVQLAVAIVVSFLLLRIVDSVRKGDPFKNENVRRLRGIALTLLIGWPIGQLLSQLLGSGLAERAGVPDDGLFLSIGGPVPVAGVGVLVLAEVFRHGVRLREDVEATV
jgi:MFS family permease